ncbi:MAG: Gfo/Idh/MocA family oxidoreductase [Lachnospiraceae bacterium]|nr:Gfo/Idh/MocA family oxidoreductase [Lachnospiraceae bacterium]
MYKNVLIVGLGGIGYRHFQAVLKCKSDIILYAVDISKEAIERARNYQLEIGFNKDVFFYYDINKIRNMSFDVAIIATSSKDRKKIFENILKNANTVHNIIFEKVLFNDLNDYEAVKKLLSDSGATAYVNCTGRENKDYQKLKQRIKNAKYYKFSYRGSNWGLACNSIHKIDMIAFLTNYTGKSVELDGSLLENQIYESKRKGYSEFYGSFSGKMGENITFVFECDHDDNECIFDIYTDKGFYSIREGKEVIVHEGEYFKSEPFELEYVSDTSTVVVDNLLNERTIFLPGYEESVNYHMAMLKMFLDLQNNLTGKNSSICDIT